MIHGIPGKSRHRFDTQNIYQPDTVASPFQLRISHAFFQPLRLDLLGYCWAARMTNQPSANRLFLLGPPSPPYVKLFCWPCLGNGIQVNIEAWDNWNAFFFLPSQPCICKITFVPHTLYMFSMFPPPLLRLTPAHDSWLFSISPLQPSSLLTLSL